MTTTTHQCDSRCSHRATLDSLAALGYTVQRVEKVCGSPTVVVPGDYKSLGHAKRAAWAAGDLVLCTRTARSAR